MSSWRLLLLLGVSLGGCGGGAPAAVPATAAVTPSAPVTAPPPLPDRSLRRSVVRDAVAQGLGVLLHHVELDERPVRLDGKFHGFRIAALRDAQFWSGVDLKAGDVLTAINGFPIESPDQAQLALDSLRVASELRVSYDRDGQPREIVYAIVDDK
jgi:type II secretion system protein C